MNRPFTVEEKEFIKRYFHQSTNQGLADALGRSVGGVKVWARKLGLQRITRFDWTGERVRILVEMYPNNSAKTIAVVLKTNDYVIYKKAEKLHLKKTPEYLAELNKKMGENLQKNGFGSRFQTGHKPWSAGKKIGTRGRIGETQFKKGQTPHNKKNVGDIAKPAGYWKIKIAEPNVWEFLHIKIWTDAGNEIPEGNCVVFTDKNPDNCILENLECVTRKELYLRNSIHNLPDELKQTIQTLGRLTRAINRSKKNAEKQNI